MISTHSTLIKKSWHRKSTIQVYRRCSLSLHAKQIKENTVYIPMISRIKFGTYVIKKMRKCKFFCIYFSFFAKLEYFVFFKFTKFV